MKIIFFLLSLLILICILQKNQNIIENWGWNPISAAKKAFNKAKKAAEAAAAAIKKAAEEAEALAKKAAEEAEALAKKAKEEAEAAAAAVKKAAEEAAAAVKKGVNDLINSPDIDGKIKGFINKQIIQPLENQLENVKNDVSEGIEKAVNTVTKEFKLNKIINLLSSLKDIFGGATDIFNSQIKNIEFLVKFFEIFIDFSGKMFKKMRTCQSVWIKTAFIRDRLSFILDNLFDILILLSQALNNFKNPLTWGKFIYNTFQKLNIIKSYLQDRVNADIKSLREIPLIKCGDMTIGVEFVKSYIEMSKTLIEKITELMEAFNKTLNGLKKAGMKIPQIPIIQDPWEQIQDYTKYFENPWNQNESKKSSESTNLLINTITKNIGKLIGTDEENLDLWKS